MKEQSKLVEARQTGKDETGGETNPSLFPQKMKQNTINVQEEAEEEVSARRRVGGDLANVVSMLITLLKSQITSAMAATCHQGVINFGEGEEVRLDSVNVADDACTPPEGICYYSRDWGNVTLTPGPGWVSPSVNKRAAAFYASALRTCATTGFLNSSSSDKDSRCI